MLLLGSDFTEVPLTFDAILVGDVWALAIGALAWHWAHGSNRLANTAFIFNAGPSFICSIPVKWSSVSSGRPAPSILCSRKFCKEKRLLSSGMTVVKWRWNVIRRDRGRFAAHLTRCCKFVQRPNDLHI